jgi:crossover junction endodeoxyribonuclease RuvC
LIILGVDPGIAIVGFGVIEKRAGGEFTCIEYGAINTPKEESCAVRLAMIDERLTQLIKRHKPDAVAVEELFFNNNAKTVIQVSQGRGVILLAAVRECGRIYEYTPLQIKQALTGNGRADKGQVQFMVRAVLKLKEIPRPDDAADALACALCHGQTNRLLVG